MVCEVPEIEESTWLKMDVEGAEYEVLPAVLAKLPLPRHISMEVHDYHNRGSVLKNLLLDHDYVLRVTTDDSEAPMFAEISASKQM